MADSKITALTSISTSTDPAVDPLVIVDVSDTSMAASGTTKKVTLNNLLSSSPTATGALTVTGLVTAGSATITGDLTVATNALKVTGNRVIIGATTVPDSFLKSYITDASAGTVGIGTGFSSTAGYLGTWTNHPYVIAVNGSEAVRVNTTGNLVLKGGTAAANGVGITFPATQVASSDANCLDDYEEGTFTPTIIGATTAGVGVYTVQVGVYTKVGRLVTVEVDLGWSAHTGTGNMQITGLPFTTNATVFTSVTLGYLDNIALTAGNIMTAYTSKSSTVINLNQTPTGGGATTGVPIDTVGRIMFSLTYSV